MLKALDRLSGVGIRVIKASKAATIDDVAPARSRCSTELADSGDDFAKSFNVFLTYPFVDEVVGRDPQVARNLHMGDYTNLSIKLDLDRRPVPTGCRRVRIPTSCRPAARLRHRRQALRRRRGDPGLPGNPSLRTTCTACSTGSTRPDGDLESAIQTLRSSRSSR